MHKVLTVLNCNSTLIIRSVQKVFHSMDLRCCWFGPSCHRPVALRHKGSIKIHILMLCFNSMNSCAILHFFVTANVNIFWTRKRFAQRHSCEFDRQVYFTLGLLVNMISQAHHPTDCNLSPYNWISKVANLKRRRVNPPITWKSRICLMYSLQRQRFTCAEDGVTMATCSTNVVLWHLCVMCRWEPDYQWGSEALIVTWWRWGSKKKEIKGSLIGSGKVLDPIS